jgi:hypothetical protein
MYLVWLAALILGSGFAIAGVREMKWRLLNVVIILGCMGVGFGLGYATGLGSQNLGRVPGAGWPFAIMFGVVGALGCVQLNRWRVK